MDVVRSNIEKLSGTVSVETTLGVGTRIDVRLPLTLAIVPSLIVRCGTRKFAIPQTGISELVRIRAGGSLETGRAREACGDVPTPRCPVAVSASARRPVVERGGRRFQ